MDGTGAGDGGPGGGDKVKSGKKVLVKKRKKRLGIACDKRCESCRVPCDTPFYPATKKPR